MAHLLGYTHLKEVKHQVQLAHVGKVFVQDLDEVVDALEIRQVVVVVVYAYAKVQARVASVHELEVAELVYQKGDMLHWLVTAACSHSMRHRVQSRVQS